MKLADIAKLANVSEATASNALSGRRRVASETRDRVLAIAEKVGYQPRASAQALSTGRSQAIGLVSASGYHPQSEFLTGLLGGLVDRLEAESYRTTVFHVEPRPAVVPPAVLQRAVDGLVLILTWSERFLSELQGHGIPAVVALPLEEPPAACDCVFPDDVEGGRTATRHLLDLGHERIAYVPTGIESAARISRMRWSGYVEEMSRARLPAYPGGDGLMTVAQRIEELFTTDERPTALVCMNTQLALMAIHELYARGMRVPDEVSVAGFDDPGYARFIRPALTVVDVPFVEIGARAAGMVLDRLDAPDAPARHVVLRERLIARDSTAPPVA